MTGSSGDVPSSGSGGFATTQWSVVARAGARHDAAGDDALAELCRRYWYPLYAYVRRRTTDRHAAQDLTQDFFAHLLERNLPAAAAPERGKFRAFLLTSLRNFLNNDHERSAAQKRGGRLAKLSLDFAAGESRYSLEPAGGETPERAYERDWAVALLAAVLERLRAEFVAAGKATQFELLEPTLVGGAGTAATFAELGAQLDLSEDAARQAALRLKRRYRELLRAEVAQTVDGEKEIDDEIRGLFEILGS